MLNLPLGYYKYQIEQKDDYHPNQLKQNVVLMLGYHLNAREIVS